MASILDQESVREKILTILRNTGQYGKAAQAVGVSDRLFETYRRDHTEFKKLCENAKEYHAVQQTILYEANIKKAALAELIRRIQNGTVTDATLLKILYEK